MTEQVMTQNARLDRAIANSPPPLGDVGDDVTYMMDEGMGMMKGDEILAMDEIIHTLAERGQKYGDFTGHAEITQKLKSIVYCHCNDKMRPVHFEALDMIMHKIGRILNGDPEYADSWHDIAGYARLAEERCLTSRQE